MADSSFFLESGVFYPFDTASGNIGGGGSLGHLAIWAGSNLLGSAGEPSLALLDTITGLTTETGVLQRTGAGAYSFLGINGSNGLVQLNSASKMPALDGSLLTNLTAGALAGALPALNGSALTSLTAANLLGALPAISGAALTAIPPLTGEVTTSALAATINKAITPTWTGTHTWSNASIVVMRGSAVPVASAIPQAQQTGQNFGTGTLTSPQTYNRYAVIDAYTCDNLTGWAWNFDINGGGGNRTSASFNLDIFATPTPTGSNKNICTLLASATAQPSVNAGGVNLFALNPQVIVYPGVTNLPEVQVQEIDLSISFTSTSVDYAHGLAVVYTNQADVTHPTAHRRANVQTAAQVYYSMTGTPGFSDIFVIGDAGGANQSPFGPAAQANVGTILRLAGAPSVYKGIDLTTASPVGADATGFAFSSPFFKVDWAGNLTALSTGIFGSAGGVAKLTNANTAATNTTWIIPASNDTFVGLAATQTLTNKTLTSPALTAPNISSGALSVATNQVVGARVTGYTAMTGSADKASTFATGSVTLAQLAGRVMQLQADLTAHGLIGT